MRFLVIFSLSTNLPSLLFHLFPLNSFSAFPTFSKSHFLGLITDTSSTNAMLLRPRKAHQQFLSWIPHWPWRNTWFYRLNNYKQQYFKTGKLHTYVHILKTSINLSILFKKETRSLLQNQMIIFFLNCKQLIALNT